MSYYLRRYNTENPYGYDIINNLSGFTTSVYLNDLVDVDLNNLIDGDLLTYDSGSTLWINKKNSFVEVDPIFSQSQQDDFIASGETNQLAYWSTYYSGSSLITQLVGSNYYKVLPSIHSLDIYSNIPLTTAYNNYTPTMTSNIAPAPFVVSASSEFGATNAAWKAFDRVTTTTNGWTNISGSTDNWLKIKYPTAKKITQYLLYPKPSSPTQMIKDWTFEGSNDDTNWTIIDTQTGQTGWVAGRYYNSFTNPSAYTYYRLNITANNGSNYIGISDFYLYTTILGNNIRPTMTANNTPAPYVVAASSELNTTYADWKAYDGSLSTYWITELGVLTGWTSIDFNNKKRVESYLITAGGGDVTRMPKDWTFEGSNDNTNWTIIDTRTGETAWSNMYNEYNVSNQNFYRYYRLNITANNGSTQYLQICEWYLYENRLNDLKIGINNNDNELVSYTTAGDSVLNATKGIALALNGIPKLYMTPQGYIRLGGGITSPEVANFPSYFQPGPSMFVGNASGGFSFSGSGGEGVMRYNTAGGFLLTTTYVRTTGYFSVGNLSAANTELNTFSVNGSLSRKTTTITGNTTLDDNYYRVLCASALTITLPTAVGILYREYNIINTSTGSITISGITTLKNINDAITIFTDGISWRISNFLKGGLIQKTDYTEFESDGTMVAFGSATTWNDIQFSISQGKVPVSNFPLYTTFIGNLEEYTFDINDYINLGAQELLHDWKTGSTIELHIHWANQGIDVTNRYVKWELEYVITNMNGCFPTGTTILTGETMISSGDCTRHHYYTSFGYIDVSTLTIGSQFKCRLKRIAASGLAPTNKPYALQIGLHYEIDTLGSRLISTK